MCVPCAHVPPVQNAFKSYVRTRDYCTSPKHIMTMCLNAVRVAVEMNNFMHVTNYVNKAEQTPGTKVCAVHGCIEESWGVRADTMSNAQGAPMRHVSSITPHVMSHNVSASSIA